MNRRPEKKMPVKRRVRETDRKRDREEEERDRNDCGMKGSNDVIAIVHIQVEVKHSCRGRWRPTPPPDCIQLTGVDRCAIMCAMPAVKLHNLSPYRFVNGFHHPQLISNAIGLITRNDFKS